jgi:hypothetical protein
MVDSSRLFELRLKGYCCSQIIMIMGLEDAHRDENPDLIQAVRGLCNGVQTGMVCGILSSAACLLSLLQPENADNLIKDIVEWFKSEYGDSNDGIACEDILAGDPMKRFTLCPQILAATYDEVWELLEANGYEF